MTTFYLRFTLLPIILLTAVLFVIRSQPYDDHELREFLFPTNCPAQCFIGIQPGVATVDEAMKFLEASAWVEEVDMQVSSNGLVEIYWSWNAQKPNWINEDTQGYLWINQKTVDGIQIYTNIELAATRLTIGLPDMEYVDTSQRKLNEFSYTAYYFQKGLRIQTWQSCSVTEPLMKKVQITMTVPIIPINIGVSPVYYWNDIFTAC